MIEDKFVNIQFSRATLDVYYIRRSIVRALEENISKFHGSLLDVGCGVMPYKKMILANGKKVTKYIGLDLEKSSIHDTSVADLLWDAKTIPLGDNSMETVMATEVLEHCYQPEIVLNEIYRVLKPNGVFFFTVPFLWPLHEVPYDEFRYTPFALKRLLEDAGFSNIKIKPTGGWNASMAQMLGLWVNRAPMGNTKRKILSSVLRPVIAYLINKEKYSTNDFIESQMITGLYGIAYK